MSQNTIFGFVAGVVVGVGGTLFVEYILNKRAEQEFSDEEEETEEYVIGDYQTEINPIDKRRIGSEKPDLEDVVDYGKYSDISKKYNPNADPKLQEVINEAIESVDEKAVEDKKEELEEPESSNIFDTAPVVTEEFTKKDAIPPKYKNKPIVGRYDIEEINRDQFHTEAMDYDKASVTWFANDEILADDKLEVMDIPTTVGQAILDKFEEQDVQTLFVSNLSTEIDYEIVYDKGSYEEALAWLKGNGDEVCQDETS